MNGVFTVVVTYNAMPWIEACITSVMHNSTVIVVDNNSADETLAYLKKNHPEVILLAQSENLGFGAANNLGISKALQMGAQHILLLNQDAKMEQESLLRLVDFQKNHSEYGLLSPIHCDWSGEALEVSFSQYVSFEYNDRFYSDYVLEKPLEDVYNVPFIAAACWLLSKELVETIGGFDPMFFHLGEDINFCQRVRYHGFTIGVIPTCHVFHDTGGRFNVKVETFSESYFRKASYRNKAKYSDVTLSNPEEKMNYQRRQLFKSFLVAIMSLKPKMISGTYKEYTLFKAIKFSVLDSVKINKTKGKHYLE